jgi:hypothetical protein
MPIKFRISLRYWLFRYAYCYAHTGNATGFIYHMPDYFSLDASLLAY